MNTTDRAERPTGDSALSVSEAEALVEKHGSQRKAAAAIGMAQSTFHARLHPDNRRERYAADPEFREDHKTRMRENYWNLTGPEYNRRLLQLRRVKALTRMAERNQRS